MAIEGAPRPEKAFHHFVHVAWYRIDAETEIIIGISNIIGALFVNVATALYILEMNLDNDYFYVALAQIIATIYYVYTQMVVVFYAFINLEFVLKDYDLKYWVEMEFMSVASIMFENYSDAGLLVYLE